MIRIRKTHDDPYSKNDYPNYKIGPLPVHRAYRPRNYLTRGITTDTCGNL